MTDRYDYLIVALEKNTDEDDASSLIEAIKMLRGVLSVHGHVADPSFDKLWDLLRDESG